MKDVSISEIVKNMTKNGHMYGEEVFTQINLSGDDIMPYKRRKAVVHIRESRYQSQGKNKPEHGISSWDLVWIDQSGKRKQKTLHGTKQDADAEAFKIASEIQKILNIGFEEYETLQRKAKCINDIPGIFVKAKIDEGWSEETNKIFGYAWKYFINGNVDEQIFKVAHAGGTIERIIPRHFRNFVAYLRTRSFGYDSKSRMSSHTQSKYLRSIRTCLKWLHQNDYIEKDPTRGVKGPKVSNINVKSLSLEEVQYALDKTKDHPRGEEIYALIVGYLYFGCRATELLPPYLTWDKYDGESINRPNFKQNKAEVEWLTVPLNGTDGEVLKGILDHRLKNQEKWPYPFPYTYWQVRGLLTARYFKSIGLNANLQTLRDTAATLRQLSGQSLSAVSALLGHSSTSVTTKYYTDKDKMRGLVAGSLNITKAK